jgi:hypothetical protein
MLAAGFIVIVALLARVVISALLRMAPLNDHE